MRIPALAGCRGGSTHTRTHAHRPATSFLLILVSYRARLAARTALHERQPRPECCSILRGAQASLGCDASRRQVGRRSSPAPSSALISSRPRRLHLNRSPGSRSKFEPMELGAHGVVFRWQIMTSDGRHAEVRRRASAFGRGGGRCVAGSTAAETLARPLQGRVAAASARPLRHLSA